MSDTPTDEPVTVKCKVECECGWTDVFSAAYSGLMLECPECGKRHLIPTFQQEEIDDTIDMSTMNRLLEQQQPAAPVATTVNFRPIFAMALTVGVIVAIIALAAIRPLMPLGVAVAGAALSWSLGISVAWLGQRRHLSKLKTAQAGD